MSALARALEAEGIATVALLANRSAAELVGPPRGLYCEFPLGRPLGKPLDVPFQRSVLDSAFALLARTDGPLIEDFGIVIEDEVDVPVSCPIPPRLDLDEPVAIAEARGLRAAHDRGVKRIGTTQVGQVVDADGIPEAIRAFVQVVEGVGWNEVEYVGGDPTTLLMDIRAYYEEAALGLSDEVPAARATESWYYRKTSTGNLMRRYLEAVKDVDPPFPGTYYVIPASQTSEVLF
ncbi:MAG: hypothetical protein GY910_24515 [bacterium]|nr:hypothetical protein [bacterium]